MCSIDAWRRWGSVGFICVSDVCLACLTTFRLLDCMLAYRMRHLFSGEYLEFWLIFMCHNCALLCCYLSCCKCPVSFAQCSWGESVDSVQSMQSEPLMKYIWVVTMRRVNYLVVCMVELKCLSSIGTLLSSRYCQYLCNVVPYLMYITSLYYLENSACNCTQCLCACDCQQFGSFLDCSVSKMCTSLYCYTY